MTDPLKSVAGALLYRHLPEEYRYRDNATEDELGDLEAYLHGHGELLDLFQGTLAQAYADGFATPTESGRGSQTWILPYLASLLGAQLVSPDLDGTGDIRRAELGQTVLWSKGKGTLRVADSLADVMADAETHVVAGWKRVAITPRLGLPPFSLPPSEGAKAEDLTPLGTPDLRSPSRPVVDADGTNPLQSLTLRTRDAMGFAQKTVTPWTHTSRRGVPCFPGSYGDVSVTTPDVRQTALKGPGPSPRRVTVFVQPQPGFFEEGMIVVALPQAAFESFIDDNPTGSSQPVEIGPAEVFAMLGRNPATAPDRITLSGSLTLGGDRAARLQGLNMLGTLTVATGARLHLNEAAIARVTLEAPADPETPSLIATNSLLQRLSGPAGFARLEYVTVLEDTQVASLQASDCIFVGPFDEPGCVDARSCVRYSRLPASLDPEACAFARARSNVTDRPRFTQRPLKIGDACVIGVPAFGQPGCGVLDYASPESIREGAEDGMEMGAYHAWGYVARLSALVRKLTDQLPLGQTLTLRHDPMLAQRPPEWESAE